MSGCNVCVMTWNLLGGGGCTPLLGVGDGALFG